MPFLYIIQVARRSVLPILYQHHNLSESTEQWTQNRCTAAAQLPRYKVFWVHWGRSGVILNAKRSRCSTARNCWCLSKHSIFGRLFIQKKKAKLSEHQSQPLFCKSFDGSLLHHCLKSSWRPYEFLTWQKCQYQIAIKRIGDGLVFPVTGRLRRANTAFLSEKGLLHGPIQLSVAKKWI